MIEIQGKYNTAKVFTDTIEPSAIGQITTMCSQLFAKGQKIRIMPDCHAGKGCTIGTTMTITDKIIPSTVGVDISCGMRVVELNERKVDLERLDNCIRKNVPSGFSVREKLHKWAKDVPVEDLRCFEYLKKDKRGDHRLGIGTLGGGNHFIELNVDEEGKYYLVIHTGSRNLGKLVAEFYQQEAYDYLHGTDKYHKNEEARQRKELVDLLTSEGRTKEISSKLKEFKYEPETNLDSRSIPFELCYVEGRLFDDYIHDMKIMQQFAITNRAAIANSIQSGMKWNVTAEWETIHNYIDTDNMILRKGAISAQKGEIAIIPMNMRDGSLIVKGKGNPDWNYSAPHGAGRLMSRTEAKNTIPMKEFKSSMEGIYSTSIAISTLDEAPQAYKPMEDIMSHIGDTCEIIKIIKPVYNFKAH